MLRGRDFAIHCVVLIFVYIVEVGGAEQVVRRKAFHGEAR